MRRVKRYDCCDRSGQLASANYGGGKSEDFLWDGLALIQRGGERFINEPHVGNAPKKLCFEGKPRAQRSARRARKGPRGNPVVSSKGTSYFNDMLGTTLGAKTKGKKYSAAALTAFGEDLTVNSSEAASRSPFPVPHSPFFTGKPHVAGLGHAFLFRNYRAGLAKWQTSDPLGYPDGWNQLTYCGNDAAGAVDLFGCLLGPSGPNVETRDKFTQIISNLSEKGNRELLNLITTETNRLCGSKPHYNYHLLDTYIDEWTAWSRTGRTKVDANGVTWYEEERFLYSYVFTTELLMEECSGQYEVEVRLFGDAAAILGFVLAITPGVNIAVGTVVAGAGILPTIYSWTIGNEDDKPIGLEFFPKLDETGKQIKLLLQCQTQWVE